MLACMDALLRACMHSCMRVAGRAARVRTCVCRISKCITRISQCISRAGHAMVPPALSRCGCGLGDSTRRPGPGEFGPLPAPAGPGQHAAANSAATSNGTVPPFQPRHRASLSRVGAAAFRVQFIVVEQWCRIIHLGSFMGTGQERRYVCQTVCYSTGTPHVTWSLRSNGHGHNCELEPTHPAATRDSDVLDPTAADLPLAT